MNKISKSSKRNINKAILQNEFISVFEEFDTLCKPIEKAMIAHYSKLNEEGLL